MEGVEGGAAGCIQRQTGAFETKEPRHAVGRHGFAEARCCGVSNVIDVVQRDHFVVVGHATDVAASTTVHQILNRDASYKAHHQH